MRIPFFLFAAVGVVTSQVASLTGAEPAEKAATTDEAVNRLGTHYRELNSLLNPPRLDREQAVEASRPNPAAAAAPARREANLQTGTGLHQGSLQPASGLQSMSRGLTPEAEWRKKFPKKPNGSPR